MGAASARIKTPPRGLPGRLWTASLVLLSCLPDLDIVGVKLGIPHRSSFGHRGALHSLAFAVLVGCAMGALAWAFRIRPGEVAVVAALVVASHGILDSFTSRGMGIAFLWPFSSARYLSPWRPLPAAPSVAKLLSREGLRAVAKEGVLFLPIFALAVLPSSWRRRANGQPRGKGPLAPTGAGDLAGPARD